PVATGIAKLSHASCPPTGTIWTPEPLNVHNRQGSAMSLAPSGLARPRAWYPGGGGFPTRPGKFGRLRPGPRWTTSRDRVTAHPHRGETPERDHHQHHTRIHLERR